VVLQNTVLGRRVWIAGGGKAGQSQLHEELKDGALQYVLVYITYFPIAIVQTIFFRETYKLII